MVVRGTSASHRGPVRSSWYVGQPPGAEVEQDQERDDAQREDRRLDAESHHLEQERAGRGGRSPGARRS